MPEILGVSAETPKTVAYCAAALGCSKSRIYRLIEGGFLQVDRNCRPMVIVGGETPFKTQAAFKGCLEALMEDSAIPRHMWGVSDSLSLHLLIGVKEVAVANRELTRSDAVRMVLAAERVWSEKSKTAA